ncbi:helix-turn-helix domain-containing protein [Peloplasma aerotolerans]|uniref:Helix-turn-helix domain-containing protein n=1 Tax=Peloplasma aerotolerans TaxID=3044389 RepID=A0AAW6U7P2_9MOLU|nr:helix-turn-helix domain-containing protein [Mariniplasma sp. M4Ah]MDI6452088.1 helix-turn-helix domain-containing protein [Mariniplasma sp. M4Ah]MDR4968726.1 helix-turn-helix domain-containing protein [Acholeplasmataceae bacterium]
MVNQYSVDFKLKIVKMILNENISKHEIERTYKVARKTQRDWVSNYETEGVSGLVSKRKIRDKLYTDHEVDQVETLKHEILLLRIEIERLKRGYNSEDVKYIKKKKS